MTPWLPRPFLPSSLKARLSLLAQVRGMETVTETGMPMEWATARVRVMALGMRILLRSCSSQMLTWAGGERILGRAWEMRILFHDLCQPSCPGALTWRREGKPPGRALGTPWAGRPRLPCFSASPPRAQWFAPLVRWPCDEDLLRTGLRRTPSSHRLPFLCHASWLGCWWTDAPQIVINSDRAKREGGGPP